MNVRVLYAGFFSAVVKNGLDPVKCEQSILIIIQGLWS